jgi:hypothetical protein
LTFRPTLGKGFTFDCSAVLYTSTVRVQNVLHFVSIFSPVLSSNADFCTYRICKRLRSPGIDFKKSNFKKSISPAYVARAGIFKQSMGG